jgi:gamma-glutamyl:cysteine ligase YbdK (ATP-grasp superfamily)
MGIEIDRTEFSSGDYSEFGRRLDDNLRSLSRCLARPEFGVGPASLGAELEMYIVDAAGLQLCCNQDILARAADPQLTLELNRYNLEYNLSPHRCDNRAFWQTEQEIDAKLAQLRVVAAECGGRIVPIGILPTLREQDLGAHCITDSKRYHALVQQCIRRRGSNFEIDINGANPLKMDMADITLEGANTSFQVHYRVNPADYADTFNAIQLVTPLALAIGANSPTLFGHSLWHETRIPLFKQSIDTRHRDRYGWNEPARVNYGHGWVRRSALELFVEAVRLYPPFLPVCSAGSDDQEIPSLQELRLHQSTVWLWNRPVYDNADGGHLRIEMRALPAGPTPVDMVANAAFLIGMAEGIRPKIDDLLPALPFKTADYNFHRAAQHGLDAQLIWPRSDQSGCAQQSVTTLITEMIPVAREGLASIGVSDHEVERYLGVISNRLQRAQTGAVWQQRCLSKLLSEQPLQQALSGLLQQYHDNSLGGAPVAEWQV